MVDSRAKGRGGEREVRQLFYDWLGITVNLNEHQQGKGGPDIIVADSAIEVKRRSGVTWAMTEFFWAQTRKQACDVGMHPVCFYRGDREAWRVMVDENFPPCTDRRTQPLNEYVPRHYPYWMVVHVKAELFFSWFRDRYWGWLDEQHKLSSRQEP